MYAKIVITAVEYMWNAVPVDGHNNESYARIVTLFKVHIEGMEVTPLKDFASSVMPAEVMKYVTLRGWDKPTLIQAHCWPVLNAGRDVIGIAETGSGKTLGFSLPAMSKIFKNMKVIV